MRCPVCGAEIASESNKCNICGTDNINPTFVNKDDVTNWQEDILYARGVFFMEENDPFMKDSTEEFRREALDRTIKQLDLYFGYSSLKEILANNPNDHIVRSWMVDYLVQVYTFPEDYPVSSRRYVRQEIDSNIGFLMAVCSISETDRFKNTCNKAVLSLFNAEVELSDGNVAQALSHYYGFLTNPVVYQGILSFRESKYYIESEKDIKYVIHNCKELCKLFSMTEHQCLVTIEDRLDSTTGSINDGSYYMHGMECGIVGPRHNEEVRNFLRSFKKGKCTIEQCTLDGKFLWSGLDNTGFFSENAIITSINKDLDRTWCVEYRTLEFVIDDTIKKQKNSIQNEINKILMLFGY